MFGSPVTEQGKKAEREQEENILLIIPKMVEILQEQTELISPKELRYMFHRDLDHECREALWRLLDNKTFVLTSNLKLQLQNTNKN